MKKFIKKNRLWLILVLIIIIIATVGVGFYIYKNRHQNNNNTNISVTMSTNANNNTSKNTNQPPKKQTTQPTPTPAVSASRPVWGQMNKEVNIGNTSKKQIALTFDAGSGTQSAEQILSILKANNLHATFFLTGKWAEQNPELVKRILANGNTIGNHSYDHPYLTKISDAEIYDEFAKTENIISTIVPGAVMKPYFRAPYGDRNQHVWDYMANLGYQSIYWTVDAWDWQEGVSADVVTSRIFSNEKNGAIILMHVGDDLTGQVLQEVITKLQNDGYKLGPLEEVLK